MPLTGGQLITLVLQLVELGTHLVQAVLELVHDLGLRSQLGLESLGSLLCLHLLAQSNLSEVVELVSVGDVASGAELICLVRSGQSLGAPLLSFLEVLCVVLFQQSQVANSLGDGGLCLTDAVGVVANHLVQHLLRVLGSVEQGVDVCLRQLCDSTEDSLLSHDFLLSVQRAAGERYAPREPCPYNLLCERFLGAGCENHARPMAST